MKLKNMHCIGCIALAYVKYRSKDAHSSIDYTVYDNTMNDLHWKTKRQAFRLI